MSVRYVSITRTLWTLATTIAVIIAFSIPAGYFTISYHYMEGSIDTETKFTANDVERLIAHNPKFWYFEEIRLQEILENHLRPESNETRMIIDLQGRTIAKTGKAVAGPSLSLTHPIYDSGTKIAYMEIKRSVSPLIARTVIVLLCSIVVGAIILIILYVFPLREVRRAYRTLEENERHLRLAIMSGRFGICVWDMVNDIMVWDERMYEIYGVSRSSVRTVIEAWKDGIHPEDRSRVLEEARIGALNAKDYQMEFRIVHPGGAIKYVTANCIVVRDGYGKPIRMVGLYHDMTEKIEAEEKIKTSLLEKELMLKEIYHRVKNNLQVISSLLNIQSSYLQDEEAKEILQNNISRVNTMALIHTMLYRSGDISRVDFNDFIRRLVDSLLQFYCIDEQAVEIRVDAPNIFMNIEKSIPCGLIINELVSNALKHAFGNIKKGRIEISFYKEYGGRAAAEGANIYVLVIKDNGVGLPLHIDVKNTKTLGLRLVQSLTTQLGGTILLKRDRGTEFRITFAFCE